MKKITFLVIISFLLNYLTSAQVLYTENFDNLTVGDVSTDILGQSAWQGGGGTLDTNQARRRVA